MKPTSSQAATKLGGARSAAGTPSRACGLVLRVLVALQLAAVPALYSAAQAQGLGRIDALAETYVAAKPVATGQARLTFYRPVNEEGSTAATVYVDAGYHTSLLKGGYTEACVKPGSVEIGLRRVEGASDVRNPIGVTALKVQGGQQQFLRVTDQPGRYMRVQVVTPEQAAAELAQTRQQVHTLSRAPAVVPCEQAQVVAVATAAPLPVTPVAVSPSQVISVSADALFPFAQSGINQMAPAGRRALDGVIARVKTDYARIDIIRVVGHADPIGRQERKQIRSAERAQTVRDYLSTNGLQSIRLTSEGRADRELVVKGCGDTQTPANILCNQPNRRVSIEITGIRR